MEPQSEIRALFTKCAEFWVMQTGSLPHKLVVATSELKAAMDLLVHEQAKSRSQMVCELACKGELPSL
jgi:hypothetical protein